MGTGHPGRASTGNFLRTAAGLLAAVFAASAVAAEPEGSETTWWDPVVERRIGLFNPVPPGPQGAMGPEATARLDSLGYLRGYEAPPSRVGVLVHDAARAQPGYNLYVSAHAPAAYLIDAHGEILHRWELPFSAACPTPPHGATPGQRWWRRAWLLPDGGLLAIFEYAAVVAVSSDSTLRWARCGLYHHDLAVDAEGRVLVLRAEYGEDEGGRPVLDDRVEILDAGGRVRAGIPLAPALAASPHGHLLERARHADRLHTNTLQLVPSGGSGGPGGDILLSMRNLHLLAALDLGTQRLTWSLTGSWRAQHEPVLLEDGAILLFDNLGRGGRSRVVEIEPATGRVRWSHPDGPEDPDLFSPVCGSVQRLGNGNTLITESTAGRAIEITRDGEVVWEFSSPHRVGGDDGTPARVALLGELTRIDPRRTSGWLGPRARCSGASCEGRD